MKHVFNDYLIEEANDFIKYWNQLIRDYGHISASELKDYLSEPSLFSDTKFGWDCEITVKDNLKPVYKGTFVFWELNIPEMKEF